MVQEISVQELAARQAAGQPAVLVDVRQPWEHEIAALPGSLLIPLDQLPRRGAEIADDPATPVFLYCHHGVRSRAAAAFLERLGRGNVFSLAGGIDAWSCLVDPRIPRY